jgi:hypothetical protein
MTSFYNRAAAMEFAGEFWNRPCRSDTQPFALGMDGGRDVPLGRFWDQRKAPSAQYEPLFVFNALLEKDQLVAKPKPGAPAGLPQVMLIDDTRKGDKLEDCAHFLSQCLKAGGLRIKEQWSVPMLVNALVAGEDSGPRPIAKTLCEKVKPEAAQRIIDAGLLNIGDMIGYFRPAAKAGEKSEYAHSAMFTGKGSDGVGRVTCHTASRFADLSERDPAHFLKAKWTLRDPTYSFTLLHIPRASESTAAIGAGIAGWWSVTQGKQTVFYFVRADGRAVRTSRQPGDARAPAFPGVDSSRGYWFEAHGKITICWRADGSLVTLEPQPGDKPSPVTIDGVPAVATRLGGP